MDEKEIRTRAVRVVRLLSGQVRAEVIFYLRETGERYAFEIRNPRGKKPYSIVDGARYDLGPHEVKKLREELERVGA